MLNPGGMDPGGMGGGGRLDGAGGGTGGGGSGADDVGMLPATQKAQPWQRSKQRHSVGTSTHYVMLALLNLCTYLFTCHALHKNRVILQCVSTECSQHCVNIILFHTK